MKHPLSYEQDRYPLMGYKLDKCPLGILNDIGVHWG